jgi:hypothetical protein
MAITNDKSLLRIGRGKFFAKRIDDGATPSGEGFVFAHQVNSIVYTPNEEKLEEIDATTGVGGTLASITVSRKPTIKITDKSFLTDFLAFALMGTKSVLTQAADAITAEVHTNVKQGTYVPFDKMGPVTAVTVEPSGGGTAFALDDDYTIEMADDMYPMLYIVPGGGIADAVDIQINYTPTQYSSVEQVAGATKSEIVVALRYIGANSYGPRYNFDVWKASVNIDAALEFIQSANEFGSFDLTFTLLDDSANHSTTPFIDLRRVDNATAVLP